MYDVLVPLLLNPSVLPYPPAPEWLMYPEVNTLYTFLFKKVPRMTINRGDYDLPTIEIHSSSATHAIWPHWTSYIRSNPDHTTVLLLVGIDEAINLYLKREVVRCRRDMTRLFCRWASSVHIQFFAWGKPP